MQGPHDRIIADAAKSALAPLGFRRKGRSRTWLADHEWWLTVVEFQPSAWSKGTYLNVAAHWLWSETGTLSLDYGGRMAEHVQYVSDAQFAPAVAELAKSAASSAQRLAETFVGVSETAIVLLGEAQAKQLQSHLHPGWFDYNAALAAGLSEHSDEAARMFARILGGPAPVGSMLRVATERMASLVAKPLELRNEVTALIYRQREALKLPPLHRTPF